jgi:hypothetical protein
MNLIDEGIKKKLEDVPCIIGLVRQSLEKQPGDENGSD